MCDIGCAVCPTATVHPLHLLCFTNSQETVAILPLVFLQEDSVSLCDSRIEVT